ncbi:MAG: hypothetical protein OEY49_16395, partial [Candidatus Heimdallarchaeota archaeon]|nr:hypothetical protein [Candidatus Heimdallarchaeota archaeon]
MTIEKLNIALSGDSAEILSNFLDDLNHKLVKAGIKDAYSIVLETQDIIFNKLRDLNKSTKITNDEVIAVINLMGSSDSLVKEYIKDQDYSKNHNEINISPSSKKLEKRRYHLKENSSINLTNIVYLLLNIGLIISYSIAAYNTYLEYYDFVLITIVIPASIFISYEIFSAFRGKLIFEYRKSLIFRRMNRLFLFGFAYAYSFIYIQQMYYFRNANFLLRHKYFNSESLIVFILVYLFVEFIIFIRDHLPNLYPLEPILSNPVKYIKIPYLFLYTGVCFSLLAATHNHLYDSHFWIALYTGISLVLVSIAFYLQRKRYPDIGFRFFVITLSIPMVLHNRYFVSKNIWLDVIYLYLALFVYIKIILTGDKDNSLFQKIRQNL